MGACLWQKCLLELCCECTATPLSFLDWTAGPISPMKRGLEQVPEDQEAGWKVHWKRMKKVCEQSMAVTKSNLSKCYRVWWLFPFSRNLSFGSNPYLRAIGSGSSHPSWKCLCVWETMYWLLSPSWSHMERFGADRVGAGGVRMKPTVDLVTVVESICMNQNETVSVVHFLGPDGLSLQFLCKAWNEMQVTKDICKSSFCQL